MAPVTHPDSVERWSMLELTLSGPCEGNPFIDQQVQAVFTCASEEKTIEGFYDGAGVYRVRFMPSFEGPTPSP
ncbi:MAG: DUF5060 domain-containing protein [Aristaeellaceae bacterium]